MALYEDVKAKVFYYCTFFSGEVWHDKGCRRTDGFPHSIDTETRTSNRAESLHTDLSSCGIKAKQQANHHQLGSREEAAAVAAAGG